MVLTGFLGGYTTFSTFAYESALLWERRAFAGSLVNLAGSVAAGFTAVVLGMALGRGLSPEAPLCPRMSRSRTRSRRRSDPSVADFSAIGLPARRADRPILGLF